MRTDVVIVGAGAAGLLAAVAARRLGHEVLVVERTASVGSVTADSDGHLWMPGNDLMGRGGTPSDSADEALGYLNGLTAPADEMMAARRAAFTRTAAVVGRWLVSSRIGLEVVKGLPDCRPASDGAKSQGRTLRAKAPTARLDDDWAGRLRTSRDAESPGLLTRLRRGFRDGAALSAGGALVSELLRRALGSGVEIWLESPMTELLVADGAVTGVRVDREEGDVEVHAERGVLLACGGFEADAELRKQHLPGPTSVSWSVGGDNDGAALRAGAQVDAALAELDRAWWTPVLLADGSAHRVDVARVAPHGMIVDIAGDRYFNEAEPGVWAGQRMYEHNRGQRSVPSFLVMDKRHRKQHDLGPWPAGSSPKAAIEAGELVRAATLQELAEGLSVDRAGLLGSAVAFNQLAKRGRDTDFRRGDSAWDKHFGDPLLRRNPCLGAVDRQPFWGVRVYPGDAGTAGGLVIDERSRVLRTDGTPVPGLWACGGAAATCFGGAQPGDGAALAAALVEAFRGIIDLSDQLDRIDEALA
ncbi:FAD-dependent oxidoreductase [Micropruina sp.]|uniref:FAD-dependent oxidoreductase n=1 Tax=Micropruina sp. TaxID=2737536 RepID=UPI002619F6D3|nr:FAD-dependent oxidoreductase [Micropruina sp.]